MEREAAERQRERRERGRTPPLPHSPSALPPRSLTFMLILIASCCYYTTTVFSKQILKCRESHIHAVQVCLGVVIKAMYK